MREGLGGTAAHAAQQALFVRVRVARLDAAQHAARVGALTGLALPSSSRPVHLHRSQTRIQIFLDILGVQTPSSSLRIRREISIKQRNRHLTGLLARLATPHSEAVS